MAAATGATTTEVTVLELLAQRQNEGWIRAWDKQGSLRTELTSQSIATESLRLRDWLAQQDWSWCETERDMEGETAKAAAEMDADLASSTQQPLRSGLSQRDRSDHLIYQPIILLAISDPAHFLTWFSAVSSLGYPLFLGNPDWTQNHWQQVQEGLTPHLIITDPDWAIPPTFPWSRWAVDNSLSLWEKQEFPQVFTGCGKQIYPNDHQGLSHSSSISDFPQAVESHWIGVPTGGSSGQLRFAIHSWNTLIASVTGLQESELTNAAGMINSCCTLPLHHVSGLMQFLRSLLSGGKLWILPWSVVKIFFKSPEASSICNQTEAVSPDLPFSCDFDQFFLSLVPTQLQQLIEEPNGRQWLVRFYTVLLGGGPAWPALLDQAKSAFIRLAPTYGMTETASQVITLHPDDFLRGQLGCGKLLPHVQIECLPAPDYADNNFCPGDQFQANREPSGIVKIRAHSLALGYYAIKPMENQPSRYGGSIERWPGNAGLEESSRSLITDDLGYRDPDGYFYIIGRASDKIISGGENVFPAAVEAAIRATGLVKDGVVLGLTDAKWGERVVAVVVPGEAMADRMEAEANPLRDQWRKRLVEAIAPALTPAQRPKQWLFTDVIPRNAQGKVQRRQLRDWAMEQGNSQPQS